MRRTTKRLRFAVRRGLRAAVAAVNKHRTSIEHQQQQTEDFVALLIFTAMADSSGNVAEDNSNGLKRKITDVDISSDEDDKKG